MKRSYVIIVLMIALAAAALLWLRENPDANANAFQRQFKKELAALYPYSKVQGNDLSSLECDLGNGLMLLNLESLFKAWRHDPKLRDNLVTHYLTVLSKSQNIGQYKLVAARVFPQIRPASFGAVYSGSDLAPVSMELFGNLAVFYVVEFPDRTVYLTHKHLSDWRVTLPTVHEGALANLLKRTRKPALLKGSPGLYAYLQGDGYDATRILIVDELKASCGNLQQPFYFAVPHRDALYILNTAGLNNITAPLNKLEALTRHLYRSSHRFLCPEVMVYGADGYLTLEDYRAQH
ncbi:MAG TPA: hypothetical protein DDZ65_14725 [Firmicutes bacterium]|nr:hypothetical protein [Bacillota bacterium]